MSKPGSKTTRLGWVVRMRLWTAQALTPRLRAVLLGTAVVWALWSCGREAVQIVASPSPARDLSLRPARWDLRSPPAVELATLLAEVDRQLPAGSLVTVATRPLPGSQDFFLYLWAAYSLPHHDVVRARHRWTLEQADYLLIYGATLATLEQQRPGWGATLSRPAEPLVTSPTANLYRLGRPETTPSKVTPR